MQLKLIKHEVCPTCGSPTVAESCRNTHCNGQGFEERTFACGCVYRWSPNAERLELARPCPKSNPEVVKRDKRERAVAALVELVEGLDVDDDWKKSVALYGWSYDRRQ